ncbi:kinase-like domain-containing protein, partial [Mycena amicta]
LLDLLHTPDNYKDFLTSPEDQAQQLLDLIQEMLDLFPDSTERPVLSKALLRLSRASGRLPTCFPLSGLQKVGKQVAAGGFGDIWKGLIRGQSVSVKIMRLFRDSDIRDILHTFGREALIWRQLSHPNVLPFFGLYYLDSRLCLVSPWMADGHVLEYLKTAPPDTDRVSLMLDVALGLEYLHENNVVHGDLKAMNILVTPSHRACVADFGLSSITDAMTLKFTHSTASVRGGTTRYQAPELISTDNLSQCSSDVYAFACVCYEIWTEQRPFFEITQDVYVAIKILSGLRPTRPENMTDDHPLWLLLQDSWVKDPTERPTITQIVHRLVDPIGATIRSYGSADWEDSFSSKLRRSLQDWPLLPSVAKIKKRIFANGSSSHCFAFATILNENGRSCRSRCGDGVYRP